MCQWVKWGDAGVRPAELPLVRFPSPELKTFGDGLVRGLLPAAALHFLFYVRNGDNLTCDGLPYWEIVTTRKFSGRGSHPSSPLSRSEESG